MERILAVLVGRLSEMYGDRLVSVILYGSAVSGDFHGRYSDLNVFCVLSRITPAELAESEPVFRWWRELGQPSPLLMTEAETRRSADAFPIEFSDMREARKVLFGRDVIADLNIDPKHYRAQLEHELRSALLRLRQKASGLLSDRDALIRLCVDSVSTFCVLGRHALRIAGIEGTLGKRETVRRLLSAAGPEMAPFETLLDVREEKAAPQELDPDTLFGKYLSAIQHLIAYVDQIGGS